MNHIQKALYHWGPWMEETTEEEMAADRFREGSWAPQSALFAPGSFVSGKSRSLLSAVG